jgi:hypothetical protein
MMFMMSRTKPARAALLCGLLGLLGLVPAWSQVPSTPFSPDNQTLFLCHFDRTLNADSSLGSPSASGNAALTAKGGGKFGRGIILQRGPATGPDGLLMAFAPLKFETNQNLEPLQGTLEMWVRPSLRPVMTASYGTSYYLLDCRAGGGFSLLLSDNLKGSRSLVFTEQARANDKAFQLIASIANWQADTWHHVALVWSGQDRALYLDGQPAKQGQSPNATLPTAPTLYLGESIYNTWPAQAIADELRISDVARYGARGVQPMAAAAVAQVQMQGGLTAPKAGWKNESQNPQPIQADVATRTVTEATFEAERYPLRDGVTIHEVTLRNASAQPQQVAVWLDAPCPKGADWTFWDGRDERKGRAERMLTQTQTLGTFPMACVYDANRGMAVGLEPSQMRSWFTSQAREGSLRWLTRVALAPNETEKVAFVSFPFTPDYRYLSAVQNYQEAFPQWFRPKPGVDPHVLTGCVALMAFNARPLDSPPPPVISPAEIARRAHDRWEWDYAYFKYGGDMVGRDEFWNLYPLPPQAEAVYREPTPAPFQKARQERLNAIHRWGLGNMFFFINWVDEKMANRFPQALFQPDDVSDHRGVKLSKWIHTYTTDLRVFWWGTNLEETTKQDMRTLTEQLPLSGFLHDVAIGGARYRGSGLWKTPGRAYDERGPYVDEGVGIALMLDYVHSLQKDGRPLATAGNTAFCLYPIAFRLDNSFYEGNANAALGNLEALTHDRLLFGSKPRCLYQVNYSLKVSDEGDAAQMSEAAAQKLFLREWDQGLLFCLALGYLPTPDLVFGYPRAVAMSKVIAEAVQAGWQPVPAMKTTAPIWLTRYGKGGRTWLALINPSEAPVTASVRVDQKYLGDEGAAYLFADQAGTWTEQTYQNGVTQMQVTLPERGALVLQAVASLPSGATFKGRTRQQWDGVRGTVSLEPAPAGVTYVGRPLYVEKGPGQFQSTLFQGSRDELLGFPWTKAQLALPESADDKQKWAAWRLQEYFRFWEAQEQGAKQPTLLPIVNGQGESGPTVRFQNGATMSVTLNAGASPEVILTAPDGRWEELMEPLMALLDERFPFVGDWTCYGINAFNGRVTDAPTKQLLLRAGFLGRPFKKAAANGRQ